MLVVMAGVVREKSAFTRFWVNFAEPEVQWMIEGSCPSTLRLNDWYMDVVSLDKYNTPFANVKPYYEYLFAQRPTAYQQLALVPGTFYVTLNGNIQIDPPAAVNNLQTFFDYARTMNQSCSLQIGRTGVTKSSDGCPIWAVVGFWGGTEASNQGNGV